MLHAGADSVPIIGEIEVGWVQNKRNISLFASRFQTCFGLVEEGSDTARSIVHCLDLLHTGKTRKATASKETHKERFDLVIAVMSYQNI